MHGCLYTTQTTTVAKALERVLKAHIIKHRPEGFLEKCLDSLRSSITHNEWQNTKTHIVKSQWLCITPRMNSFNNQ